MTRKDKIGQKVRYNCLNVENPNKKKLALLNYDEVVDKWSPIKTEKLDTEEEE